MNDTIADSDLAVTGKTVSDLQSGVKFGANAIKGTLKYVENWTWFDSDPEINTGNFLVFKSTLTDDELERLKTIPNLAPGDFRTVRQSLFYYGGDITNAMRLEALERESAAKNSTPFAPRARLGF